MNNSTKRSRTLGALLALILGAALASSPVQAQTTYSFYPDSGSFSAALSARDLNPDENVLFNRDTLVREGNPVQGITNQSGLIVNFSSNENLRVSGGQARLDAVDGAFSLLTISLADNCTFQSLQLNPFKVKKTGGEIMLTVTGSGGTESRTYSFVNGQNRIGVIAAAGQTISSVTLVSFDDDNAIEIIDDVKQVRIGGVHCETTPSTPPANVIPEPGTLALLGAGGAPALLALRRRRC